MAASPKPRRLKSRTESSQISEFLVLLDKHYPDAHCELLHETPFQLLIATVLSAQCTDALVNKVTPGLFEKYPDAGALAEAPAEDVERLIGSVNFFRNKARNIRLLSQALMGRHHGEVPQSVDELTALAGVGRKTANVVLGNAFGIAVGIVVDTHVKRLAGRFGWTQAEEPDAVEKDLQPLIPRERWIMISHQLIFHGRRVCKARNPDCRNCFLLGVCPRIGLTPEDLSG